MREVQFKGKNKNTKQWIYGDLIHKNGKEYIGYWLKDDDSPSGDGYIQCEVIPNTIGQYIGIKDIYEKKVFQGYIVKVKQIIYTDCSRTEIEEIREFTGEVVWHQFGWHIAENAVEEFDGEDYEFIGYHSLWLWNVKDDESDEDNCFMEIIGDRWSNPELAVII